MLTMDQWPTSVIVLILTLSQGCCKERNSLSQYQPFGPKLCLLKCQLSTDCGDYYFEEISLKCVLYEKTRTGIGKNQDGGRENIHKQIGSGETELPENLKQLVDECKTADVHARRVYLTDRTEQPRCVKTVQVLSTEDECGTCINPGSGLSDYRTCRCRLGCSKKIRGDTATCHRRCEVYGDTFTVTDGVGIAGYNKLKIKRLFPINCAKLCQEETKFVCLSAEYGKIVGLYKCYLQTVSWLDVDKKDKIRNEAGWKYFHRDCK